MPHPFFSSRPTWRWFILVTVLVGATMSALDVSIVNVAMPTLTRDFGVSITVIEWVAMAYMLTLTIFLPLFGRLADMFGRTKLYTFGFAVFTVGSATCGMAPDAPFLIASRVLQAVGAGLLQANSVAIITQAFPASERGRAIGFQGAVQAIAMSIGPFVGGLLIAAVSWRAIFFVNLPIGVIGMTLAVLILPKSERNPKKERIDYLGVVTFATGLAGLVLALNMGGKLGWSSPRILVYFVVAAVLLPTFILIELRARYPMIDLKLFRSYAFAIGNLTGMLSYYVLFAVLFLIPFYLEQVLKVGVALTGILLTPIPLAMAVVAPFAGGISDRYGSRIMTTSGMLACALSMLLLLFAGPNAKPLVLVLEFIVLGVGMGMFTPPNNSSIMGAAPREKLGVAGGLLNMMRSLGLIFGVDISGLIFTSLEHRRLAAQGYDLSSSGLPAAVRDEAFMAGFAVVLVVLLAINLISAALSAARNDTRNASAAMDSEPANKFVGE